METARTPPYAIRQVGPERWQMLTFEPGPGAYMCPFPSAEDCRDEAQALAALGRAVAGRLLPGEADAIFMFAEDDPRIEPGWTVQTRYFDAQGSPIS